MLTARLLLFVLTTLVTEILAGEYCSSCPGQLGVYCDSGCCYTYGTSHCCPNTTAIVVGSVFATIVVMVILSSLFICWLQHRRHRLDVINNYIAVQTQYYVTDFEGEDMMRHGASGRPPLPSTTPNLPDARLFKDIL